MVNTLLIVRHSERIDESKVIDEKASWKQFVANDKSKRHKRDLQDDPILTKRGVLIAKDAAQSLYSLLNNVEKSSVVGEKGVQKSAVSGASAVSSDNNASNMARKSSSSSGSNSGGRRITHSSVKSMPIDRIYTSRLRRCVETAYQLALLSHLPLYVCTGLALTAIAVERRKGAFEFHSMQEIRRFCPGTRVVSCDNYGEECAEEFSKECSEEFSADGGKERSAVDSKEYSSEERSASDVNFKVESGHKGNVTSTIISAQTSSTAEFPSQYYVPTDDWLLAITAIAERHPYSVVVAHRESIRNLTDEVGLPGYCHTAVFHHTLYDDKIRRNAIDNITNTRSGKNGKNEDDNIHIDNVNNINSINCVKNVNDGYSTPELVAKSDGLQSKEEKLKTVRSAGQFSFQYLLDERGKKVK